MFTQKEAVRHVISVIISFLLCIFKFFTYIVPPWLQPDTECDSEKPTVIGPSLDAFLAAKKAERLKKLNPNRVGANLDRCKICFRILNRHLGHIIYNVFFRHSLMSNYTFIAEVMDKNWVPNFGRVWNYGTRRKTRNQFKRESEKGNQEQDHRTCLK